MTEGQVCVCVGQQWQYMLADQQAEERDWEEERLEEGRRRKVSRIYCKWVT